MNVDQFWALVGRVHGASDGSVERKCELLGRELRALPPAEVQSFMTHWGEFYYLAYDWGLWGAAYLIFGGCSDDSFMDFRSSLIFMGREIFERALDLMAKLKMSWR